jgi:hypothetical protein
MAREMVELASPNVGPEPIRSYDLHERDTRSLADRQVDYDDANDETLEPALQNIWAQLV